MKSYAEGGEINYGGGPGRKGKKGPNPRSKRHPSCKGPSLWADGNDSKGSSRSGQQAGKGPTTPFDRSRMISQKEIERKQRKKENEGMTLGQRVMRNAQEKKNKKAAEAAAKERRYAGPRFL
jgi:hypothetical protein